MHLFEHFYNACIISYNDQRLVIVHDYIRPEFESTFQLMQHVSICVYLYLQVYFGLI